MRVKYIVGCPAWERAWSLDLWFQSVMDNVPPDETGLVFVVPSIDEHTREIINQYGKQFAWLEVMRDRNEQFDRLKRGEDNRHETLAMARNQILHSINGAKPELFLSWDSDLLLPPGTIEEIEGLGVPICTAWTWLNRQPPREALWVNAEDGSEQQVQWQEPVAATAMRWAKPYVPVHYPAEEWHMRASNLWRTDVVLAFSAMRHVVYSTTSYGPHRYGEEIPFNWSLHKRGIPRYCLGDRVGLHLYQRDPEELELGWPGIMRLADKQVPLPAQLHRSRDPQMEALGFYYVEGESSANQSRSSRPRDLTRPERDVRPIAI